MADAPYHLVEEDGSTVPVTEARAVPVHVTVVRQVKRKPRACGGGCCCCLLVLLVLLLALLLPRSPAIRFRDFDIDGGASGIFVAKIKFKSHQPVKYTWKDLDLKLQYKYEGEVYEVAKFSRDSSFKTEAYGTKKLSPSLEKVYPANAAGISIQCASPDGVIVRLKGHVHNYENTKFPVQTAWKNVICES